MLTGASDGVRLKELESQKEIIRFQPEPGQVTVLDFSPDGKWVVCGTDEGTVAAFDVEEIQRQLEGIGLGR